MTTRPTQPAPDAAVTSTARRDILATATAALGAALPAVAKAQSAKVAQAASPAPAEAPRPPLPPFNAESAARKARAAEDAWNTRDPERVAAAYTPDSDWRNRAEFFQGRAAIVAFLRRKWARELDYRLIKEVWAYTENHIAVRFVYEWHDDSGLWFRSHGNEQWEFEGGGYMRRRQASINDVPIAEADRKFRWPLGPRPDAWGGIGSGLRGGKAERHRSG